MKSVRRGRFNSVYTVWLVRMDPQPGVRVRALRNYPNPDDPASAMVRGEEFDLVEWMDDDWCEVNIRYL